MISRMWRGWTSRENGDAYEALLLTDIFPGFATRNLPGYHGFEIHRRDLDSETEFQTILHFDSIADIKSFAGDDYTVALMQPQDLRLLSRWDSHVEHYTVVADRIGGVSIGQVPRLRWIGLGLTAFGLLLFMTIADDLDHEAELAFAGSFLLAGIACVLASLKRKHPGKS